jgi:hypothetical protein
LPRNDGRATTEEGAADLRLKWTCGVKGKGEMSARWNLRFFLSRGIIIIILIIEKKNTQTKKKEKKTKGNTQNESGNKKISFLAKTRSNTKKKTTTAMKGRKGINHISPSQGHPKGDLLDLFFL